MTITALPSPQESHLRSPMTPHTAAFIAQSRETAKRIVQGKYPRKALIVGPCSIHDCKSAMEYAGRFKEPADVVGRNCFTGDACVRGKPRISRAGKGYGMIHLYGATTLKRFCRGCGIAFKLSRRERYLAATEFVLSTRLFVFRRSCRLGVYRRTDVSLSASPAVCFGMRHADRLYT